MTDQTEGFVQEVSEELRRDQITKYARKYGWILVVIILGAVGYTAYSEWSKSRVQADAEARGEAILAALENDDLGARVTALESLDTSDEATADLAAFLKAQALLDNGQAKDALIVLDEIATGSGDATFRDLALLKALMLRGDDLEFDKRISSLDALSAPGRPFRISALEQRAIALISNGQKQEAIDALNALRQELGATATQSNRWQQLILALGGVPENLPGQSQADQ